MGVLKWNNQLITWTQDLSGNGVAVQDEIASYGAPGSYPNDSGFLRLRAGNNGNHTYWFIRIHYVNGTRMSQKYYFLYHVKWKNALAHNGNIGIERRVRKSGYWTKWSVNYNFLREKVAWRYILQMVQEVVK